MPPVLFDTSVYITAMRARDDEAAAVRRIAGGEAVWLSSVVLEELYAGVSARDRRAIERLERDFERVRRILVPNLSDWARTGTVVTANAREFSRLAEFRRFLWRLSIPPSS